MPGPKALSERERRFVEFYLAGKTQQQAAIEAGFSKNGAKVTASRLLRRPHIKAAIAERHSTDPKVLDRERLQVWWSQVVENPTMDIRDRLKASELLGRSQGAFLDRHELNVHFDLEKYLAEETAE